MTDELPKIVLDEEQDQPSRGSTPRNDQNTREESAQTDEAEVAADGPVAFRSNGSRSGGSKTERTQEQDT